MGTLANAIRALTGTQVISGRKNTALNLRTVLGSVSDAVEYLEALVGVTVTVQKQDPVNTFGKDGDLWFNDVSMTTERRYLRTGGVWIKFYDNTGGGPAVPGAPIIGTATAGDSTATANFSAPPSDGGAAIQRYHIFRNGSEIGTVATSPYVDNTVANGTGYSYQAAAENVAGIGPRSAISNLVTPMGAGVAPTTYYSTQQSYTTVAADYTAHCPGSAVPNPYVGVTRTSTAGAVSDTTSQTDVNNRALALAKAAAIAAIACVISYDNILYGGNSLKEISLGAVAADTIEFNNTTGTDNSPITMEIFVGSADVATVTFAAYYLGKPYRFTHGSQYTGTFVSGQVNY
jgi:hypothetical protein